jgi:sodium-dependent dicarboxylate transporter 2/3/5
MLTVTAVMSLMTELTSNTATTELMLPILAALCERISVHPLLLMVPATLACSYAFMLPVATPPNAIVYGSRRITQGDMLRAGLLLNGAAVLLLWLLMMTLGSAVFGIAPDAYPAWGHIAGKP